MNMRRPQNIGTDDNGYRQLKPRTDQPCDVRSCRSNDGGGCIKMFNAGRRPENFGTPRCPGFIRCAPSPPPSPSARSMRMAVRTGQQTHFESISQKGA